MLSDWQLWQPLVAAAIAVAISILRRFTPSLRGERVFWANLLLQFLLGMGVIVGGGPPAEAITVAFAGSFGISKFIDKVKGKTPQLDPYSRF